MLATPLPDARNGGGGKCAAFSMVLCCFVRRRRFLSALLLVLSACARSFAYYYERSQFDSSVVLVADVGQLEQSDFSVTEYWRCFVIIGTIPDAQKKC